MLINFAKVIAFFCQANPQLLYKTEESVKGLTWKSADNWLWNCFQLLVVEISIELCTHVESQLAHASIDRFLRGTSWRVMIPSVEDLIWFEHVSGCLLQDNTLRSPDVVALCTWCIALLESRDNTLMLRQEGSASLPNSAGVHEGNPTHSVSKSSKCDASCLFPQTPAMKWTRKPLESLNLTKSAVISREIERVDELYAVCFAGISCLLLKRSSSICDWLSEMKIALFWSQLLASTSTDFLALVSSALTLVNQSMCII